MGLNPDGPRNLHVNRPVEAIEIPINGLGQTGLKRLLWLPSKLSPGFTSIDRIAVIMARAIGDELNATAMILTIRTWSAFVKNGTNCMSEIYIADFVISANVVTASDVAFRADSQERRDMVIDVKPIAHVLAFSIYQNRLTQQSLTDYPWNQFFAVLKRAIIVRTIRDNGW